MGLLGAGGFGAIEALDPGQFLGEHIDCEHDLGVRYLLTTSVVDREFRIPNASPSRHCQRKSSPLAAQSLLPVMDPTFVPSLSGHWQLRGGFLSSLGLPLQCRIIP